MHAPKHSRNLGAGVGSARNLTPWTWLGTLISAVVLFLLPIIAAAGSMNEHSSALAFKEVAPGKFSFDTGVLRGRLGPPGRGDGLSPWSISPLASRLDRGANGYGLFSHYRVFSDHKRYGHGAWDWPKETRLLANGAVELHWRATADRPIEMRAVYRWCAPDALDLTTEVIAHKDLTGFESFLAAYFTEPFTNALIDLKSAGIGKSSAAFAAVDAADGVWQMFPRDEVAVKLINDGRWQLPPNPVAWKIRPFLDAPIAVRRAPVSGVTAVLMAAPKDCFAIAMPHQTEPHYSVYFSLGGTDLNAGQIRKLRTHLWVTQRPSESADPPALQRLDQSWGTGTLRQAC